jgi:hypothetical protein
MQVSHFGVHTQNMSGKISFHPRNVIYLFMFKHLRTDYTEQGMEQNYNSLAALLNEGTFIHCLFSTRDTKAIIPHTDHSSLHYVFILCTIWQ